MLLAAMVGLATGFGAVTLDWMIEGIHDFLFDTVKDDWLGSLGDWRVALIPALGAILVGPIVVLFAPEAKGHGVPEVVLAIETRRGRIRARVAAAKAVASALTIGSGGAVGKEGPIVQIGSALGSALGQFLRLSEENLRLLVACGAAGGIAATFNAPLAGVFFSLEVILRRFTTRNFSVVVLSAVVATVTAVAIRGDEEAIPIPPYELESGFEIPIYALLGVVSAAVAVVFIRTLYWAEDYFEGLRFPPPMAMPVLGGALIGLIALLDDGVLGLSQDTLGDVLAGEESTRAMAVLLVLALAAICITIGSGASGGVFRPALFVGAMAGGVFGSVVHGLFPGPTATSGAYATVGMAAVFAGAARAPITAVLILFEMTRDYGIVLPAMTAVAAATVVSQLLSQGTIYSIKLARRGVHIDEEPEATNVMYSLRVADTMSPIRISVSPDAELREILRALDPDPEETVLVLTDDGEIEGLITHYDVAQALLDSDSEAHTARDICTTRVSTIFVDESLHNALATFANQGVRALPVVDRSAPKHPLGMLRRSDITHAYTAAVEASDARVRRRRLAPATRSDDVRYLDLRVGRGSRLDGLKLADIELTPDAVVVAVRHNGTTLIPRGLTRLQEGDRVTVITTAAAADEVRRTFEDTTRS
jgi:CIC family chloride channel protein